MTLLFAYSRDKVDLVAKMQCLFFKYPLSQHTYLKRNLYGRHMQIIFFQVRVRFSFFRQDLGNIKYSRRQCSQHCPVMFSHLCILLALHVGIPCVTQIQHKWTPESQSLPLDFLLPLCTQSSVLYRPGAQLLKTPQVCCTTQKKLPQPVFKEQNVT